MQAHQLLYIPANGHSTVVPGQLHAKFEGLENSRTRSSRTPSKSLQHTCVNLWLNSYLYCKYAESNSPTTHIAFSLSVFSYSLS